MDALGKLYEDGDVIVEQGEVGDCMFVIQSGEAIVTQQRDGHEVRLGILAKGDFFGEMAVFEREARSATVRSRGESRVLTVDKKALFRRISEDPSVALSLLEKMSRRIRDLNAIYARVRASDRRNWESRPEDKPQPV